MTALTGIISRVEEQAAQVDPRRVLVGAIVLPFWVVGVLVGTTARLVWIAGVYLASASADGFRIGFGRRPRQ